MTQRERQILNLIEANPMISQQELADRLGITRSSVAVHISNLQKKGYIAGKGYVLRSGSYAVVVGGINIDIGGSSFESLVAEDSNPGKVQTSLGGVGRNIAHNLALMGADVRMLSACGDDVYGQRVVSSCAELGIDAGSVLKVTGATTSTYLYIADRSGEMALAISDMAVCDYITPAYLAANQAMLQNAQIVMVDTNIPVESIVWLCENVNVPIFCDPVSTKKAVKLLNVLDKIHTLKPNRLEAELLSGVKIEKKEDAAAAARALIEKGVHRVFISMGADGVYAAMEQSCSCEHSCKDKGEEACSLENEKIRQSTSSHKRIEGLWMENITGNMVNTTGCGDSAMAAIMWAYLEGMTLSETACASVAAGSITMESNETINPAMSASALKSRMKVAGTLNDLASRAIGHDI